MGVEIAIAAAVISAGAAVVSGVEQYNATKDQIKATRQQEAINNSKLTRNIKLKERQRVESLSDQARQQKIETGKMMAEFGASGLNMNFGSPLELQIANEVVQGIDSSRLNSKFDDAILSEHIANNSANFALQNQREALKSKKTGIIWSTVGQVANAAASGMSGGGSAPGGAPAAAPNPAQSVGTGSASMGTNLPGPFMRT